MAIRRQSGIVKAAVGVLAVSLVALAIGAAGCSRRAARPIDAPVQAASPPPPVQPPPPPVHVPPPPSEVDVTLTAASEAEARGDFRAALDLYERAAGAPMGQSRSGDIHYAMALVYVDPTSGLRNIEQARVHLQQVMSTVPRHARAREAQSFAALIDELVESRARSAELKTQIDGLQTDVAKLKDELEKKEQELKIIKQVLQQKKP